MFEMGLIVRERKVRETDWHKKPTANGTSANWPRLRVMIANSSRTQHTHHVDIICAEIIMLAFCSSTAPELPIYRAVKLRSVAGLAHFSFGKNVNA